MIIAALICGALAGLGGGVGLPWIFEKVFQGAFESRSEYSMTQIILLSLTVPALFITRGVFGYISGMLSTRVAVEVSCNLQQDVFDHLQAMPMAFFDTHQRGDLQTRLNRDTGLVQSALLDTMPVFFIQPFTAFFALCKLIQLSLHQGDIGFLVALVIMGPICLVPAQMIGRKLRRRSREQAEHASHLAQHLWENFSGINEIRSFNLEEPQKRGFQQKLRSFFGAQFKIKKYLLLQQPIMESLSSLLIAGIFIYAWWRQIDFGVFSAIGAALYFVLDPIKRTGQAMNLMQSSQANAERLTEFFSQPVVITDPPNPKPLNRVSGKIVFDHVNFAYGDTTVLNDVSVVIPAGCNCALVGPSGAGKSTFAKLIPRFYDVRDGRLTVDGVDIRDVRQADLRLQVAVVSQHPVLFDLTLLENIRLGRPKASDEQVFEAARRAHADSFIRAFPEGYNTLAGDRGDRLSGGQKQRLAIARAFLKNAPILLLDEATSALDSESEQAIQAALADLTKGRTVITIAHRLSTIRDANLILVFDEGRLAARGTHAELMQTSPMYQSLVQRQITGA
jgi:subfamily B ATP-binding cassette protein MsbA